MNQLWNKPYDMNQDYIIAETSVCIKMMLRKYPSQYHDVLEKLKNIMRNVEETQGKCAIYATTTNDTKYASKIYE